MGIWHLSLVALTKENAENIKSYAKELNEKYDFHPYNESTLTGLEYIDMGVAFDHGTPDCLSNFHKFSEEIAAHFSEVKLVFTEFDSDTQHMFTSWSNNGILRLIEKCEIELYAADNFELVQKHVASATEEAGLELDDCTEDNVISFTYDALQEQKKVDVVLDPLSMQFPNYEIVCLKKTDNFAGMHYESFCIISNGSCEWHQLDYTINYILMGICSPCNKIYNNGGIHRFDAVRNPAAAVEKLLDKIRKGNADAGDKGFAAMLLLDESEYQRKFMELVRPEDQEWLDCEILRRKELSEMLAKCGKA